MNNDLISRSGLMELAKNHIGRTVDCNDIARFPMAVAEPEHRAKWLKRRIDMREHNGESYIRYECSYCGFDPNGEVEWNYCPNCGAKMEADDSEITGEIKRALVEVKKFCKSRHCASCELYLREKEHCRFWDSPFGWDVDDWEKEEIEVSKRG